MPKKIFGKPVDEEKWSKAKEQAASEGHAEDYAYITGIYKRMVGMKKAKRLLVMKLEKGRKAVPDGTIMDVKGTPYKRMKQGGKWIHVKVNKQGTITNMAGQVIGQTTPNNNQNNNSGQQQPAVKRGRGRPRKDASSTQSQAQQALAQKNSTASSQTHTKRRGRPAGYRKINGVFVHPDKLKAEEEAKKAAEEKRLAEEAAAKKAEEEAANAKKKTPRAKKADKKDDSKKRDTYLPGDKVMRKNSAGNYYWSMKESDGTWTYIGLATPTEVKAYVSMQRKKAKAEKMRAESEKQKAALIGDKKKDTADPDWNADGTPKQSALDKMGTKEKLYWTQATDRARKIADKCGVLCMDKEAEDYVEAKLEDVFKISDTDKKNIDAVKADVPLDTDGKFADDPVFMQDTLDKLTDYLNSIESDSVGARATIRNRLLAEATYSDPNNTYYPSLRSRYQSQSEFDDYIDRKVNESYDDLVTSLHNFIEAIRNDDKDKVVLGRLHDLDETLSGFKNYKAIPYALVDHAFGDIIDNAFPDDYGNTVDKSKLVDIFKSLGFNDHILENAITDRATAMDVLLVALNPNCDENNCKYLFTHNPNANTYYSYRQNAHVTCPPIFNSIRLSQSTYSSEYDEIQPNDPGYISPKTFFDNAEELRKKYHNISEAYKELTIINNDVGRSGRSQWDVGLNLDGTIAMRNNLDPGDLTISKVTNLLSNVAKTKSHSNFASDTLQSVLKATNAVSGDTDFAFDRVPVAISKQFNKHTPLLSNAMKDAVTIPDERAISASLGMIPNNHYAVTSYNYSMAFKKVDHDYLKNKKTASGVTHKKKSTVASKRGTRRGGFITYAAWKRDNTRGGGRIDTFVPELSGETSSMKNAIRAKWNNFLSIQTGASYKKGQGGTGADTHASASLAIAVGLNWQIRKLLKDKKIIPDWKWYNGTKPYTMDNKFSTFEDPQIDNSTINRKAGRYRGRVYSTSSYKHKTVDDDAPYRFTEDDYRNMLTDAKNDSIAVELGLVEAKKEDHPSPKIVLRTNKDGADAWEKKIDADWTHSGNFGKGSFKVNHVFDIMYHDYYNDYKKKEHEVGNVDYGYHGTDFQRAALIIKGGFKTGLPQKTGNMLGNDARVSDGTYIAKSSSKSAQYVAGSFGRHGSGVMFQCRVAWGKMNAGPDWYSAKNDPSYDSIFAKGGTGGLAYDEYLVRNKKKGAGELNPAVIPIQWIDVSAK